VITLRSRGRYQRTVCARCSRRAPWSNSGRVIQATGTVMRATGPRARICQPPHLLRSGTIPTRDNPACRSDRLCRLRSDPLPPKVRCRGGRRWSSVQALAARLRWQLCPSSLVRVTCLRSSARGRPLLTAPRGTSHAAAARARRADLPLHRRRIIVLGRSRLRSLRFSGCDRLRAPPSSKGPSGRHLILFFAIALLRQFTLLGIPGSPRRRAATSPSSHWSANLCAVEVLRVPR